MTQDVLGGGEEFIPEPQFTASFSSPSSDFIGYKFMIINSFLLKLARVTPGFATDH